MLFRSTGVGTFTVLVFVLGFFMSLGKAAVYKHIPHYFPDQVGSVGGLVGVIGGLGGFVMPFLTLYLTGQRGISVSQAALMVSLFGAGSFTASLVGGELTDRLGRRPVMLFSFLLAPANMIALGAFVEKTKLVKMDSLFQSFEKVLGERYHSLIPSNIKAVEIGAEFVRSLA